MMQQNKNDASEQWYRMLQKHRKKRQSKKTEQRRISGGQGLDMPGVDLSESAEVKDWYQLTGVVAYASQGGPSLT